MAGNFVCSDCRDTDVPPHMQFAERLEYRSLDTRTHLHYRTKRLLCRSCVERIKAGDSIDQTVMF